MSFYVSTSSMSFSILLTLVMNIIKGYLVKIAKCNNVNFKIKHSRGNKKCLHRVYDISIFYIYMLFKLYLFSEFNLWKKIQRI